MSDLFVNKTSDGDSNILKFEAVTWGMLQIEGTWDEATVTAKGSLDGGTTYTEPVDLTGRFTEDTLVGFFFTSGHFKLVVSGAGSSTDLTAKALKA